MPGLILRQTLEKPINGFWDGGEKKVFDWKIDYHFGGEDKKGKFVRVGSWDANFWFNVSLMKTEKQTLALAKKYLTKHTSVPCKFEYVKIGD